MKLLMENWRKYKNQLNEGFDFQHAMGVDNRDEAIEAILDFESEVHGRKVSDLEDLVDLSDEELAQKYASITSSEEYKNMIDKMAASELDQKEEEDEFDAGGLPQPDTVAGPRAAGAAAMAQQLKQAEAVSPHGGLSCPPAPLLTAPPPPEILQIRDRRPVGLELNIL